MIISAAVLSEAKKELKKKTTLRIWAKENGFNYQTLVKFLGDFTGKRQIGICADIVQALRKDGFLK